MKIAGITLNSVTDGEGLRTVIFTQGCSIHCPGCHNPESHDKRKGRNYNPQQLLDELIKLGFNNKITLSGGEPLEQNNEQLLEFLKLFKQECKNRHKRKSVWLYSGKVYSFNDLVSDPLKKEIFSLTDFLVDGPFIQSKKRELLFRGSSNQRIINMKASFGAKKIYISKKHQYPDVKAREFDF